MRICQSDVQEEENIANRRSIKYGHSAEINEILCMVAFPFSPIIFV